MVTHPNKVYVSEYKGENPFGGESHFVIVVAAANAEVARAHVKKQVGIDVEPTWLMNAGHQEIFDGAGNRMPSELQVRILSNCNFHTYVPKHLKK